MDETKDIGTKLQLSTFPRPNSIRSAGYLPIGFAISINDQHRSSRHEDRYFRKGSSPVSRREIISPTTQAPCSQSPSPRLPRKPTSLLASRSSPTVPVPLVPLEVQLSSRKLLISELTPTSMSMATLDFPADADIDEDVYDYNEQIIPGNKIPVRETSMALDGTTISARVPDPGMWKAHRWAPKPQCRGSRTARKDYD